MAGWKILTLIGLLLNVVGVILLFFYVLPRRQRTGGTKVSIPGRLNPEVLELERHWDRLSAIGLWCVIIGVVLQGAGVLLAP